MTEPTQAGTFLIIGIGNTLRRDDGAGWLFAEALATELAKIDQRVHLEMHHQLTPELAADAAELGPTDIVCVDASVAVRSTSLTPLADDISNNSVTHNLTPGTLLALMRRLYAVNAKGWLVEVPGQDFGHGEALSEVAQRGLRAAPAIAAALRARTHGK